MVIIWDLSMVASDLRIICAAFVEAVHGLERSAGF